MIALRCGPGARSATAPMESGLLEGGNESLGDNQASTDRRPFALPASAVSSAFYPRLSQRTQSRGTGR
eukprot:314441-Hanusia_phi.AAC.1